MPTGATGQLGLALPVQGELSGTWGDTVNNGITQYTNIAIAATLTLTNDGAVTLANTTGDATASNIVSSLTGAGTVTAQFAIVRVTGTLTTAKVVTAPSYSKTYIVVNAATGGIVTFKASGQTGVSIAVGESASVYYNGTDYVKVATSTSGTGDVVGPASATANGIALFNSTTGKLIKDSAASDGLIYGLTVGRGGGGVATNVVVGDSALAANTTGASNTAIGSQALLVNTTGTNNTAVGILALSASNAGNNTAIGDRSMLTNTSGSDNTALGRSSLRLNSTGTNNTGLGYNALYNTTASYNVAVGSGALQANSSASFNTAVGHAAAGLTTTGINNTAIGAEAFYSNTTGTNNVVAGRLTAYSNTTGAYNTEIGIEAGYTNQTGNYNTFLGMQAGYTYNSAGNVFNTFVGVQAGYYQQSGDYNTYLGTGSGAAITTGARNTILGTYSGNQGGLDIRTASNYVVLSDGNGNPRMYNNGTDWFDAVGKLRAVPQSGSSKTTSYTLATTDIGEYILLGASGAIVIPDATFAAGDVVTIFNNTASTATITCSITTAYIAGTFTDKATMTLAAAGVATALFITSTLVVVSGNVT